jgi:hypothetical protein
MSGECGDTFVHVADDPSVIHDNNLSWQDFKYSPPWRVGIHQRTNDAPVFVGPDQPTLIQCDESGVTTQQLLMRAKQNQEMGPRLERPCHDIAECWCKILYAAVSDWAAWEIAEAQTAALLRDWSPFTAVHLRYYLLAVHPGTIADGHAFDLQALAEGLLRVAVVSHPAHPHLPADSAESGR